MFRRGLVDEFALFGCSDAIDSFAICYIFVGAEGWLK
jgi:hypothetical protein